MRFCPETCRDPKFRGKRLRQQSTDQIHDLSEHGNRDKVSTIKRDRLVPAKSEEYMHRLTAGPYRERTGYLIISTQFWIDVKIPENCSNLAIGN
jgi:hypothetical protein